MSFPNPNSDKMVVRKVPHLSVEQTVDNMRTLVETDLSFSKAICN